MQLFVIDSICICLLFAPDFASALCFEECLSHIVRRENGGCCAQFCTHVGDGSTFRNRQGLDTLAAILDDLANAALYGHPAQHFQNDILCSHPRRKLAGQFYLDNLRAGDVVRTAAHCHCNIQTAGTHGDHTDTAACGGMAVRADQGLARHAKALQMHLMADTIARTGEIDAVLLGNAADETVVICVFETALQGVVIDIGNAALRAYTGNSHCLKFQICHCAGGILCQCLVDADSDLRTLYHFALYQVGFQDFFRQGQSHCPSFLS